MSTFYRAPEIRFLQAQGKLNGTLDPWSDSENDDDSSFTDSTAQVDYSKDEKMDQTERAVVRPYEEKDREAVAHVVCGLRVFVPSLPCHLTLSCRPAVAPMHLISCSH